MCLWVLMSWVMAVFFVIRPFLCKNTKERTQFHFFIEKARRVKCGGPFVFESTDPAVY